MLVGVIAVAGALGSGIELYSFLEPRFRDPPAMKGDLNIAVAKFRAVDASGDKTTSRQTSSLPASVHRTLKGELAAIEKRAGINLPDLELRPPEETGEVSGSTPAERAGNASKLARSINADIVLYGTVQLGPGGTRVNPEVFIAERKVAGAEEITGQYRLGAPLKVSGDIEGSIPARAKLRGALSARAEALAQFVVGLGYFSFKDFPTALDYFEAAQAVRGWREQDGKEILYVFLGNTAGKLRRLDRAGSYYRRALRIRPNYGRALFGVAEVTFQHANGGCKAQKLRRQGVSRAIDGYQKAARAASDGQSLVLSAKASFGLGRSYLCLSQAGVENRWREAQGSFEKVVMAFQQGVEVRDEAAEASAGLGFIALPREGRNRGGRTQLQAAASRYRDAIRLSRESTRQALFYSVLGFIYERLEDRPRARTAYEKAVALEPDAAQRREYRRQRDDVSD